MSEFRIDQITNQSGSRGPDIAGITTFSATSGMLMPSGDTRYRYSGNDGPIVTDGLVFYIDAAKQEFVFKIKKLEIKKLSKQFSS
jgi:hypothetical protein